MIEKISKPDDLFVLALEEMAKATGTAKHEFHTFTLGTVHQGFPYLRTVVLRKFERECVNILFHTDIRSAKIDHLQKCPQVSLLSYGYKLRLQVSFNGVACIEKDSEITQYQFENSSEDAQQCYAYEARPGSILNSKTKEELQPDIQSPLTSGQLSTAKDNFVVVRIVPDKCDILCLHHSGHIRVRAKRTPEGWVSDFITA